MFTKKMINRMRRVAFDAFIEEYGEELCPNKYEYTAYELKDSRQKAFYINDGVILNVSGITQKALAHNMDPLDTWARKIFRVKMQSKQVIPCDSVPFNLETGMYKNCEKNHAYVSDEEYRKEILYDYFPELRPKDDLTGQRFGRLVVIGKAVFTVHGQLWQCRCDCGNTTTAYAYELMRLKEGRNNEEH